MKTISARSCAPLAPAVGASYESPVRSAVVANHSSVATPPSASVVILPSASVVGSSTGSVIGSSTGSVVGSSTVMVDKSLVNRRFSRVVESYHREAVAQRRIAEHLVELLHRQAIGLPLRPHLLEIGCGTGFLTRPLVERFHPGCLVLNDLCAEMRRCFDDWLSDMPQSASKEGEAPCDVHFLAGDAETLLFPDEQDLIVSSSVVQWFRSPETFFARCRRLLKSDGYLAFSTFGGDNLKEVTALTGAGLTYRTLEEWKELLAPHFDVLYAGEERITLSFVSPLDVLYHLKHTGVTAVRQEAWTPGNLRRFCRNYIEIFGMTDSHASEVPVSSSESSVSSSEVRSTSDGAMRIPLTYHPLYFLVRPKPSASVND